MASNPQATIRTPQLAEVIQQALAAAMKDLHVCLPAQVQSYDSATQTCSVSPVLQHAEVDSDGSTVMENYPVITGVPVVFPSGGGYRILFPVQPGDYVLLIFSDRSLDIWKSLGGSSVNPLVLGTHDFNDAVAIPGIHPNPEGWNVPGGGAYFGKDGGPEIEVTGSNINLGVGSTHFLVTDDLLTLLIAFSSSLTGALDGTVAAAATALHTALTSTTPSKTAITKAS